MIKTAVVEGAELRTQFVKANAYKDTSLRIYNSNKVKRMQSWFWIHYYWILWQIDAHIWEYHEMILCHIKNISRHISDDEYIFCFNENSDHLNVQNEHGEQHHPTCMSTAQKHNRWNHGIACCEVFIHFICEWIFGELHIFPGYCSIHSAAIYTAWL